MIDTRGQTKDFVDTFDGKAPARQTSKQLPPPTNANYGESVHKQHPPQTTTQTTTTNTTPGTDTVSGPEQPLDNIEVVREMRAI